MPDTSAISVSGLFMRDNAHTAVPLAGVSIEAEINGFCARVAVAHRYVNRETTPIEAVYVFPLSEGAAVCGFEAVVDGTLVVGEVQEREKAFETYDEAMEQGHGAFLLDEERPDIFQASVGNLLPGKEVLVRLTYVTELAIDAGRVRFTIPTAVSPRYAPGADRTGVGRPDAQALNPPVAWTVPYGLDLSMRIAMPGRVMAIESPSHPIALTINEHDAAVTLAQNQAALDRDFVLAIQAAETDSPQALIERGDDGHETVAVSFVPAFTETTAPAEVIFVVDRSGSMGGTSIQEVRNALQLCLRSMISGCRFNIIGFGATYESLFSETRVYDQTSLDAADKHVANLRANLGGTEILPALKFALEQPRDAELPRQIVVLTDGQVSNTDAVLALVAAHATDTRLFTFGIGAGASEHLVRGLARAGGGTAEFIYPGERIEPKVVRQFGRLLSPAVPAASGQTPCVCLRGAQPALSRSRFALQARVWRLGSPSQRSPLAREFASSRKAPSGWRRAGPARQTESRAAPAARSSSSAFGMASSRARHRLSRSNGVKRRCTATSSFAACQLRSPPAGEVCRSASEACCSRDRGHTWTEQESCWTRRK
jgi:hypothetical protein